MASTRCWTLSSMGSTGPVIVPMTIVEPERLSRNRRPLYANKATMCGISAPLADRRTTSRRLRQPGLGHAVRWDRRKGRLRGGWRASPASKLDPRLERLQGPEFAEQVLDRSTSTIGAGAADQIAASAGPPANRDSTSASVTLAWIGARQIRLAEARQGL